MKFLPTKKQTEKIKKWLLYAVTKAEAELGSGTGELKLRHVYDLFLTRFPMLSKFLSFELFSKWVDEALESMKEMLNRNVDVKGLVDASTKSI